MALHLNKLKSPSPKDALCQDWLKLVQWFWRRRFLIVVKLFFIIFHYLPFGKDLALHLKKLESPSPMDTLCQVWLKLSQWFWRRRFLKFLNFFLLFLNYLPFGRIVALHWKNLNSLHPGIFCSKFSWKWPCGSGEEDENVKKVNRRTDWRTDRWRMSFQLYKSGQNVPVSVCS